MRQRLKLSALMLFAVSLSGLQAQKAIIASGGDASGGGGTVSFSVGQIAYSSYSGSSGAVSEGIQIPFEIFVSTGFDEPSIDLLMVLPNPVKDQLILKIDDSFSFDRQAMQYKLYDLNGKILIADAITGNETTVDFGHHSPGTFLLKVFENGIHIKTFTIIKHE